VIRAWALALVFSISVFAQDKPQPPQDKQPPPAKPAVQEEEPPEEDASLKPKEYSFNPLQASKEVRIGEYYFKKKSYRAAANRFREATHWNPSFPDAFLRLAETEEKLKDQKAAREAYAKYLELNPTAKDAESIKKKLGTK
jgi:tetratricopeptide (TPR) repeat protein